VGTQSAKLKGFTITQKGNASVNSILSLSSVDDTGLQTSSIDGVAGSKLFKNGTAFISTESVLLPGAMHLFTLKVALVANANPYILSQLKLTVDSVVSNAKSTKGLFPVRGVTWTIAQ
jgi:hypothetical protein